MRIQVKVSSMLPKLLGERHHNRHRKRNAFFVPAPDPAATTPAPEVPLKVQSVEDFVPEDSLDRSFLDDPIPQKDKGKLQPKMRTDSDR